MKTKNFIVGAMILFSLTSCGEKETNPLLAEWKTPFQTPPFDKIELAHYKPAFEAAITEARAEVDAIVNSTEEPTMENTVLALDKSGKKLDRVANIFFNLNSAATSEEMQAIAREVSPMLTDFSNDVQLNLNLFAKVKKVYGQRESLTLTIEEAKILEDSYKGFVRGGANLSDEAKTEYRAVSKELSELSLKFDENELAETNAFDLLITNEEELAGLPDGAKEMAAMTAKEKEKEGWMFTLQYPSYIPVMKYADNRDLREKMYRAFTSRAFKGDERDNQANVKRIVELRLKKANLLGYNTYADYVLEERMAENAGKVLGFLNQLHEASKPFALKEYNEVEAFAKKLGLKSKLQRWDWSYYSEKLKKEKYSIDDEQLKPYFKLENVQAGIFELTNRLFGLKYVENTEIPVYHKDVKTFEVYDENDKFMSILYLDFFPRASKGGGAWMTSYRSQEKVNGKDIRPFVSIVCNFTQPTETKPSLLTFNEVTTFLHEFGHALHGMLANCEHKSVSGTSVYRDFVELPSQIMENYATEKEWLDLWAVHYETGEKLPAELIKKIIKANNFNAGYGSERQLSFGMTDMAWHSVAAPVKLSVGDFEANAMSATDIFEPVEGSNMSVVFGHIFAGGYAAGYYGYKWAEVLDADAFAAFKENGIFDKETAKKFRENILEKGGSEHPMVLYKRFRGQEPTVDALLKRSGLKK